MIEPQHKITSSHKASRRLTDIPTVAVDGGGGLQWRFYDGNLDALISHILQGRMSGVAATVAVCNVHMFMDARRDRGLAQAIGSTSFAICDGQPIAWLVSILKGRKVPRITGPDLFERILLDHLETMKVALVGGTEQLLEKICSRLDPVHRRNLLTIDPGQVPAHATPTVEIISALNRFGPDIVFVGLGCPKQEKWMSEAGRHVSSTFIGVGAAFQYFAGDIKRAPDFARRSGLEWAYRLIQQPHLLARYGRTNIPFLFVLLAAEWARLIRRGNTRG
ncbi:MAG: WecB/TagA/CpsF family glycosyltransferase [Parvibaculum sp.]|uniref:WecB/TagA/CpsF family glycosyltransferase n=1 Tax=Parvibaculum sp. TaxID=2024848 RepID=UPI003C78A880